MRRPLILAASTLLAMVLPVAELWGGGRTSGCEVNFEGAFDPGVYEFVIVSADKGDLVRNQMKEFAQDVIQKQPALFNQTEFSFTDLKVRAGQLANAIAGHSKDNAASPAKRAYVIVGDVDIEAAS